MSFVVSLATDFLSVDAGVTTPLGLEIINRSDEPDVFEVTVEGIDPEWVSVPANSLTVEPASSVSDSIFLRPQRSPENAAGTYPFLVRTRSLNSGESRVCQGSIEIKPFHQLSLDVEPKRIAIGGLGKSAQYTLKVLNLSNVEHPLQIFANEPDNRVHFGFEFDRIVIGPGQEREILIEVSPAKKSVISNGKMYSLSFSVRSGTYPTVAAYANAQLEHRAVMSPVPTIIATGVILLGVAWWSALPRAPIIDVFTIDPYKIDAGKPVHYTFHVSGARQIQIATSDQQERNTIEEGGEGEFVFHKAGNYTITITATKGNERSTVSKSITVNEPATLPLPVIDDFTATPRTVQSGDAITVHYKLGSSVSRARILPISFELDLKKDELTFVPTWLGKQTLTLVAENVEGKEVRRDISIEVQMAPQANIVKFEVFPQEVKASDGKVAISWRVIGAVRAQLVYDDKTIDVDAESGSQEIEMTKTGDLKLIAIDSHCKKVERSIKITVIPDSPETENNGPTTTPPTTIP